MIEIIITRIIGKLHLLTQHTCEFCKNATSSCVVCVGNHYHYPNFVWRQIGVCVFSASASVGALFYFKA